MLYQYIQLYVNFNEVSKLREDLRDFQGGICRFRGVEQECPNGLRDSGVLASMLIAVDYGLVQHKLAQRALLDGFIDIDIRGLSRINNTFGQHIAIKV